MTQKEKLIELIKSAIISARDNYGMPYSEDIADFLLAKGVIVLPCKVGDKVYVIEEIFPSNRSLYKRQIKEIDISSIEFFSKEIFIRDDNGIPYLIGEIFFNREKAEAVLEKMKGE